MTVYIGNLPSPVVNDFVTQQGINKSLSDCLDKVSRYALGNQDTFYNVTTINNTNNGLTLTRSSKQNLTAFIISNLALNIVLPLPADIQVGDCFRFCVTSGNPTTYNITLNLNGNLVNGSGTAIIINTDKVIELICLNTGYLKGLQHVLIA